MGTPLEHSGSWHGDDRGCLDIPPGCRKDCSASTAPHTSMAGPAEHTSMLGRADAMQCNSTGCHVMLCSQSEATQLQAKKQEHITWNEQAQLFDV